MAEMRTQLKRKCYVEPIEGKLSSCYKSNVSMKMWHECSLMLSKNSDIGHMAHMLFTGCKYQIYPGQGSYIADV